SRELPGGPREFFYVRLGRCQSPGVRQLPVSSHGGRGFQMKARVIFVAVGSAASAAIVGAAPATTSPRPPITGVSHIAVYAAAPAKSERFYVHDLGGVKGSDPENANGVRYYFAP